MEFNEANKVIIDSMDKVEARVFVLFLLSEIYRHEADIEKAQELIEIVCGKFDVSIPLEVFDGRT